MRRRSTPLKSAVGRAPDRGGLDVGAHRRSPGVPRDEQPPAEHRSPPAHIHPLIPTLIVEREEISVVCTPANRCAGSPPAAGGVDHLARGRPQRRPVGATVPGGRPVHTAAARRPRLGKLAAARLRQRSSVCSSSAGHPSRSPGAWASTIPMMREMRVSHETIYQSLFVQGRGALRARAGRAACAAGRASAGARGRRAPAPGQLARHGPHQRAAGRGRGPRGARPLGGRPHHRRRPAARRSAPWSSARPATCSSSPCPTAARADAVRDALAERDR